MYYNHAAAFGFARRKTKRNTISSARIISCPRRKQFGIRAGIGLRKNNDVRP